MPARLFIIRPTLGDGGADRVTLTLLDHLPTNRFRPTLVLMRREGELLPRCPPRVPIRSLRARSLWTAWLPLARLVRKHRPEILFSTSSGTNMIAAIAHLLAGRPGRLVLSERNVLQTRPGWKKGLQRTLKRVLYPHADLVTAVSEGVKKQLVDKLGLRSESVLVVYSPLVDESLGPRASEPVVHPWFGDASEEKTPVVVAAGRLVPQKDHATLLRAFAQLREAPEARLVILGKGPLRAELETLAAELRISDAVCFPGYDPNPFKYMSRCEVFVLSSRHEGLPGVLVQAMACGAAVVSTDCDAGPREIITHEHDGLLVPVGDSEKLGSAIGRLLVNGDLRRGLGRNARESSRRFTVERCLPLYTRALLGLEESDRS